MSTKTTTSSTVRTYRGKSLEELIPKIQAELGPDAIILREREGLTGGVNGFFAQRCVEVDVQAPGALSPEAHAQGLAPDAVQTLRRTAIDFYDDADAALPSAFGPAGADRAHSHPLDELTWVAATPPPDPAPSAPAAPVAAPAAPVPVPAPAARVPAPAETAAVAPADSEELSFAQRLALARRERAALAPEPAVADGAAHDNASEAPADAPAASPTPAGPVTMGVPASELAVDASQIVSSSTMIEAPAGKPTKASASRKAQPGRKAQATAKTPAVPRVNLAKVKAPRGARALAGARRKVKDPVALDAAAAGAVARELISRGVSEMWAHELIVTAAAHMAPFAPSGGLRDSVRATLAGAVSTAPPLPSTGAAVAFVGAGGAGKTRCAAALATAYACASTLATSVVSLSPSDRGKGIKALLSGVEVAVTAAAPSTASRAVAAGRDGGLVILDTTAASPADPAAVSALDEQLAPLALDAVYLAVPATLSATAARSLVDALQPLAPTALVITHADEADQLGTAAELASLTGLPIAFVHAGLDLHHAIAPADAGRVAEMVLP